MDMDDLILVSVDDHVVEPPDMFERHVSKADLEHAPTGRCTSDERTPTCGPSRASRSPTSGSTRSPAARPRSTASTRPRSTRCAPGCYDVHERVRDMNVNGVLGVAELPVAARLLRPAVRRTQDQRARLAAAAGPTTTGTSTSGAARYPGRFIPLAHPADLGPRAAWPPRSAGSRRRAATRSRSPRTRPARLPELPHRPLGPVLAARARTTAPSSACTSVRRRRSSMTAADAPIDVMITLTPMNIVQSAADLIWSPMFRKFPNLKIALSEGGIGWIPYFLERIDYTYQHHKAWTHQDFGDKLPSQVFHEHIVTCFIDDPPGCKLRDDIGVDMVTGSATTRTPTRRGRTRPRSFMKSLGRPRRRRHQQDHARERDAHLPVRPVRAPRRRSSARSARCAPRRPTSTWSRAARGRSAPTPTSASFVDTASRVLQND